MDKCILIKKNNLPKLNPVMKIFKFRKEFIFLISSLFLVDPLISNELIGKNEIFEKKESISIDYLDKQPDYEYILGEGDIIFISISPLVKILDGIYSIDADGSIYLPKINRVFVKGLTTKELTILLNEKFQEFVKEPSLEIRVVRYRPVRYYIQGEVEAPGLYYLQGSYLNNLAPYLVDKDNKIDSLEFDNSISQNRKDDELQFSKNTLDNNDLDNNFIPIRSNYRISKNYFPTLHDAIREAGGISNYSDLSNIEVIRKNNLSNGGGKIKASISLVSLIDGYDQDQNIRIYDGDIIKIKKSNLNPRLIAVFISGRVEQTGKTTISRGSSLNDALELAGGPKFVRGRVIFTRFNLDGSIDRRKIPYSKNAKSGSFKNPYLKSGDIIRVGKNPINIATEVLTEITSPFLGIYSTIKLFD